MKYAIITDIHEDIVNLRFALNKIQKFKCDEIICLGDISGFSAPHYSYYDTRNASECLRLIRENCSIIISGNHDLHAARLTPKINPEFDYPANWYQLDYNERKLLSNDGVWLYEHDELSPLYTKHDIEYLKTLPELHLLKADAKNILLSHYCFPNLTGSSRTFYNFIEDFEAHHNFMKQNNCHFSFTGHRHFAGLLIAGNDNLIGLRLGKKHQLKNGDCVLVPAITGKRNGNGFCIYDSTTNSIESIRI